MAGYDSRWRSITEKQYRTTFKRFGGSFAVHPDVISLVATLAQRPPCYVGLMREGVLVAAVPLWGNHVVATRAALEKYGAIGLVDVGDAEVVLPIAPGAWVNLPFQASMLSSLHADNITNLEGDRCPYNGLEDVDALTLARGFTTGRQQHSGRSRTERRRPGRCGELPHGSIAGHPRPGSRPHRDP